MEFDRNPFPKIRILPTITEIGRGIRRLFETDEEESGAAACLDSALYDPDYDDAA